MTMDKNRNPQDQAPRKPYSKPAVESERVFETTALGCGKCQNPQQVTFGGACARGAPVSS